MTSFVDTLQHITFIKGSRGLLFGIEHVYKVIQLMNSEKYVSRATFCRELSLGEGSVKTLILHLKKTKYADSIKSGTFLLEKGKKLIKNISKNIPIDARIDKNKFLSYPYNHTIILKTFAHNIVNGMQQRDFAIKSGASAALTIFFKNKQFWIAMQGDPYLIDDEKLENILLKKLEPKNNDVIIITSALSKITAELSAKSSALFTLHDIQSTQFIPKYTFPISDKEHVF